MAVARDDTNQIHSGAAYGFAVNGDCDDNGAIDVCEIVAEPDLDADGNGVLDACETPGDTNGDGVVDVEDLLQVILDWGACPGPPTDCAGDRRPKTGSDQAPGL